MGLKRTAKRDDELHNELYNNAVRRLRGMLPPQSLSEKLYPHLNSMNSKPTGEEPKQSPVQGWAHLKEKRSQQKE